LQVGRRFRMTQPPALESRERIFLALGAADFNQRML